MLGEANLQVVNIYTNNDNIEKGLKDLNFANMTFKRRIIYNKNLENDTSQVEYNVKDIIPYNDKCSVGKKHYLEELAISSFKYREKCFSKKNEVNLNIIDMTKEKINLKEIYIAKGGITFVTGNELTRTYLGKVAKGDGIMINIPDVNDCIECVKYFYYMFNSIQYFGEDFSDILLKAKGKCVKNIVTSKNANDIIKYLNFEYEDKRQGVYISMYKGRDMNSFGEYMESLEKELLIGECRLYCNEYYNCENDEEYYLGFIL
ncbi:MAG: hypothetical protein ACRC7N_08125 [Clostridium sp.]